MKQRKPLPQPIDQDCSTIPCNEDYLHSGLSQTPNPSANEEPFDYRSKLAENAKKIERMKQQSTNTSPFTSTCYEPHANADSETVKDDSIDPTLLAAVTSLDNFLIQYPRQLNLPADIPCYQPLPDRRPLSQKDCMAQQTAVLRTINLLLGELCEQVSLFIAAPPHTTTSPAPNHPIRTTSTPTILQLCPITSPAAIPKLLFPAWPLSTPVPNKSKLPATMFVQHRRIIPANTNVTCTYNKPMQLRTKDHLRPP